MPRIVIALERLCRLGTRALDGGDPLLADCEVLTASLDGEPVTSMGGLKWLPTWLSTRSTPNCSTRSSFRRLCLEKGEAFDFTALATSFRDRGKVLAGSARRRALWLRQACSMTWRIPQLTRLAHEISRLSRPSPLPEQPQAVGDRKIVTAAGSSPDTFTIEVLKALDLYGPEAQAELSAFAAEHRR